MTLYFFQIITHPNFVTYISYTRNIVEKQYNLFLYTEKEPFYRHNYLLYIFLFSELGLISQYLL